MHASGSDPVLAAKFQSGARFAGIFSATLGALVLLGWSAGLEVFKDPAHLTSMKPNTAVCFLLCGIALAFAGEHASRRQRVARKALAAGAAAIAALTALEYLLRANFGIDELLFKESYSPFTPPGRMALVTAFSFLLLGLALDLIDVHTGGGRHPCDWLATASLLSPLFGTADYALDWSPELTGIAVHTVVGLIVLGLGVLAARPGAGWMATVTSAHSGGTAARRLLPFAFVVPLAVGILRWLGEQAGFYSAESGVALMVSSTTLLLMVAILWNAQQLDRAEERRLAEGARADQELRGINRALRTIHHCGEALVRAQTEDALLRDICRVIVDDGGYRMAWVGFAENDAAKHVRFAAHCGVAEEYAKNANITWDESDRGRGPTGTAIRTGEIQICADFLEERHIAPWRDSAIAQGFRSSAVFPLKEAGKPFGALSIYSAEVAAFRKEEMELLSKLADDLAYGIVALRARQERDRIEHDLEKERQRFSDVLDRLPAYVVLLAPDYTVPFANKYFREKFGESNGRRCYEYLFDRESPCEICESFKVLRDGQPRQWDWTGPDGRDYEIYDYLFRDARGTELVLEMGIDVTERKQAEKKARQASLYARSLLEASLDPLVTISRNGRIMDVNHAAEVVTGHARDHLIGSDFSDYFTEPDKARAGYKEVFEHGSVRDYALTIRHLSGPGTEVLYNATLYRNAAGEIEGVFAAARDVTERKRAEEALAGRTAELERSNKELEDFASIASHDLQEPLRKVMAFGDRLREHAGPALDETANDYLRRMQNAAGRMSSLVEALLEYSRVATKARPFERVDLNAVLAEVLSDLEMRVQESSGRVDAGRLPAVLGDRLQMRQLLQNLIANALKFHRPGEPPRVRLSATPSPNGNWSIAVQDDGIGFDGAYADRIFRPFQRLHGRREFPGSGMGLAICRKIVERHGGTISARSRPGEGATFTFMLSGASREEINHANAEAQYAIDCRRR